MLGLIKNRKEIGKSSNNYQNNLTIKEKINKLNKLNILNNQFAKQNIINSTLFNSRINLKDNNKRIIFLSDFQKKDKSTKYFKKNKLAPINQKYLHKANSVNNIFQSHNKLDILSSIQTLNKSKKKTLQKIKQRFNNSSFNNNINNISGFNSTKNNNTNYTNNSKIYLSSYNNNFSETRMPKNNPNFSKFFYKSQNKFITSKKIFRHYIREEERDKVVPIKFFKKGGAPKSIKELKELNKDNIKFERRIKEIKCNSTIAFKDDFNILDYQTTLIKLLSKRVSDNNLNDLQKNFVSFNEKNFGMVGPKGRFTNMAEKIKYNIPSYLYEKIRQLDTDKLISRYNYYKNSYDNIKKKFALIKNKKNKKNKNKDLSKENIQKQINNSY